MSVTEPLKSPSFPDGVKFEQTEAEYRASKPLTQWDVIKRAAEKKEVGK